MTRFSHPRLITFDDPAYRAHVEEMMLQRANQRALQPPGQRDLFGGEAEELLRTALAEHFTLSPRRILDYNERRGQRMYRKFRELDALVEDQQRVQVFEIKASCTARALHRAMAQLRDISAILEPLFRTVATTLVFVDTGVITRTERDALMLESNTPERLPQTLAEAIDDYPALQRVPSLAQIGAFPAMPELVVLQVKDVVALASAQPLSLRWDEDDDDQDEVDATPPAAPPPVYTSGDADEENPFAAALRNATAQPKKRREGRDQSRPSPRFSANVSRCGCHQHRHRG